MPERKGICIAGNMIVDFQYPVTCMPKIGELATITGSPIKSIGGAVCNVLVDLAKLDPKIKLRALGRIGDDSNGEYILEKLSEHDNISLNSVKKEGSNSFTFVMNDEATLQRTFFQYRGANAQFCQEDIDWNQVKERILHVGYILLLDTLDEEDYVFGTKMARLLNTAKEKGMSTSIDVVSETGDRFKRLVPPALRYTDYCIINEIEAEAVTDIPLRSSDRRLLVHNMHLALTKLKDMGVSTWAVIHAPEGGFGLDEHDRYVQELSFELPKGYVKGKVGAGDAFCAGVLLAAHNNLDLAQALHYGNASGVCSLGQTGATENLRPLHEVIELYSQLEKSNPQ